MQIQPQSLLGDFKEGLHTVKSMPWLWITIAIFALSNVTLASPHSVVMPFLVDEVTSALQE